MDDLAIIEVRDRTALTDFINLPKELYRSVENFTPHLDMERRESLDRQKNPYFDHAQAALFVAYRRGRAVGRISAQICRLYQDKHGSGIGHFGYLDAIDDDNVTAALLHQAEDWLGSRGIRRIEGPFHFSSNEEIGLMVDGFSSRSVVMMPYHPPYLGRAVEKAGYNKVKDVLAYDLKIADYLPLAKGKITRESAVATGITIRALDRKNTERDLKEMLDIFNDAWADNWGMIPFTPKEVEAAVKALKPIIIPSMLNIAELHGKPAAMVVCLPNLNEAIADLNGRLLPFGWIKLLARLKGKRIRSGRIPLMGIRKLHQRTPASMVMLALLFDALVEPAKAWGFQHLELSWILEDNLPMRRVIEAIGGKVYKTYRLYEKVLLS